MLGRWTIGALLFILLFGITISICMFNEETAWKEIPVKSIIMSKHEGASLWGGWQGHFHLENGESVYVTHGEFKYYRVGQSYSYIKRIRHKGCW